MLPVHLAFLLIHRVPKRTILRWAAAAGASGLALAPWVLFVITHINPDRYQILTNFVRISPLGHSPFGLTSGPVILLLTFLAGYQSADLRTYFGYSLGVWPVVVLMFATARRFLDWIRTRAAIFLVSWLLIVVGTVFLLTFLNPGFWSTRYMFLATPPLFFLLAVGMARLIRRQGLALLLVVGVFASLTILNNVSGANPARDRFREAAAIVQSKFRPGDGVAVYTPMSARPFEYYFHPSSAVVALTSRGDRIVFNDIRRLAEEHRGHALWIVIPAIDRYGYGHDVYENLARELNLSFDVLEFHDLRTIQVGRYWIPLRGPVA
jgi:hypothetical protein